MHSGFFLLSIVLLTPKKKKKLCFCQQRNLSIFACLVTILITEEVQNLHIHVLRFLHGVTIFT